MVRVEFSSRPINASETLVPPEWLLTRTLNMYQDVIQKLFNGTPPKKTVKNYILKDSLGRIWDLDLMPKSSSLYVRRYFGNGDTLTQGFRTDPYRKRGKNPDDKHFIKYWKTNKGKSKLKPDQQWMIQEAEAVLGDLITNSKP